MNGYQEAVTEARSLVKRSEEDQWRLAQLTFEQVGSGRTAQDWAQDIGIRPVHAMFLRRVWSNHRSDTALPRFADAYAEAKGMPLDRIERRENEAVARIRKMIPERKAMILRELFEDPEVTTHAYVIKDREREDPGSCPSCHRHRDWGCRFGCPQKRPPHPGSLVSYESWAREQKEQHAHIHEKCMQPWSRHICPKKEGS